MSATQNHQPNLEAAIVTVRHFCSTHSLLKSDELLCRALTCIIAGNYATLSGSAKERLLNYFEALEEVLPALYEIEEHLIAKGDKHELGDLSQTDSSRRLFASLKRHPE